MREVSISCPCCGKAIRLFEGASGGLVAVGNMEATAEEKKARLMAALKAGGYELGTDTGRKEVSGWTRSAF